MMYDPTMDDLADAWVLLRLPLTATQGGGREWEIEHVRAEAMRAINRLRAEAWDEGHASGRDYQADGWNADAHDPEDDNPYRDEAGL